MDNATHNSPNHLLFQIGDIEWDSRRLTLVVFTGLCAIQIARFLYSVVFGIKATTVGYRSWFEPGWLVGLRFVTESGSMITDGYRKVSSPFPPSSHLSISLTQAGLVQKLHV